MYKLIIGKSRSKSFEKVVEIATSLGGNYDGNKIIIEVKELSSAYEFLHPLFKYNVFRWSNTEAYINEKKVNPYISIFQAHLKKEKSLREFFSQLDVINPEFPDHDDIIKEYFLYYKREGNIFYFKNDYYSFDISLKGKELYEFLETYDIGDEISFYNEED